MNLNHCCHINNESALSFGSVALHLAAHEGCYACVKNLIEARADINAEAPKLTDEQGRRIKNTENQWLISGWSPLFFAIRSRHVDVVAQLISAQANVNTINVYGEAPLQAVSTHLPYGFTLTQKESNHSFNTSECAITQQLLEAGANVNSEHTHHFTTALHSAVTKKNSGVVKELIKYQANVNHSNENGETALIFAVSYYRFKMIQLLLDSKANPDGQANRNGRRLPPLIKAAQRGDVEATKILIEARANVNAQLDTNRKTALHLSIECDYSLRHEFPNKIVEILLDNGARIDILNTRLQTAVHLGRESIGRVLNTLTMWKNHSEQPYIHNWQVALALLEDEELSLVKHLTASKNTQTVVDYFKNYQQEKCLFPTLLHGVFNESCLLQILHDYFTKTPASIQTPSPRLQKILDRLG